MRLGNLMATYSGDIPPRSTSITYCGVSIFRDACYQFVSAFLIIYITFAGVLTTGDTAAYVAQMSVINIIIIVCRIWDGINDPIMGYIIEKVHFKWGKYKPWILIGGVLNTIVVLVLFLARPSGWGFVVLFGIFYFLWDIVWTINDIAYWSMLPSLTKDERRRNNITTAMQICISVGVFGIYGVTNLLPGLLLEVSTATIYTWIAVVVSALYLISQIVLVFVCKEHTRSIEEEKKDENAAKLRDIFKIFLKNSQVRINILSILLNYLAAGVLVAFATYYCYLTYGYRESGTIAFMFTVMYAVGTIIAQVAYPFLARLKWFTRKKFLIISLCLLGVGYLLLFFMGFPLFGEKPLAYDNLVFLLYIPAVIIFLGQGIIAIVLIIQMQSTIEYNQYKYGQRKEAIVSSLRALVAKWGSAIQQGIVTATLAGTGLYAVTSAISNLENESNAGIISSEEMYAEISELTNNITSNQLLGLAIGMIFIPLIIFIVCIVLAAFVFKIDEKKHQEICQLIDEGKTLNEKF